MLMTIRVMTDILCGSVGCLMAATGSDCQVTQYRCSRTVLSWQTGSIYLPCVVTEQGDILYPLYFLSVVKKQTEFHIDAKAIQCIFLAKLISHLLLSLLMIE